MTEQGVRTESVIEEFRRRLDEARFRLLSTVTLTTEEMATLEAHQPGGPGEDVPRELVSTIMSRLEGQGKHELDEIEAARYRLEAGAFGVCEACGAPIPLIRLRALPTARYCVMCQVQAETRTV